MEIPTLGEITLEVEFGGKTFTWTFAVAKDLFCPLILGVNILKEGCINFNKRRIKINDAHMPFTFTLKDLHQHTVIAAVNKVIPARELVEVEARIIRDVVEKGPITPQTYIVTGGGIVMDSVITESTITNNNKGDKIETIMVLFANETEKKRQVARGDILATVKVFHEKEYDIQYSASHLYYDGFGDDLFSITNDDGRDETSAHHIASIVAIKLKGGDLMVGESGQKDGSNNNRECQPELKGSPVEEDNHKKQEGWVSNGMVESIIDEPEVSSSDQRAITIGDSMKDLSYEPSYTGCSDRLQSNGNSESASDCVILIQNKKEKEMEMINSQELLNRGNKVLMEQLIEEREKESKTVYSGATQEIIEKMITNCECSKEEKTNLEFY